ncbi:MAG: MtrAB system histidine kinase MtrB, partial [Angustibacter sp.]
RSRPTRPGIAIGSLMQVPIAGQYEMYFIFSLDREQGTIDLVRRSLLVGGSSLVLLVGIVSYIVTRQVVRPVRQAALVAHRLSSGRLHERMVARGEDDLALLASSFNSMAQNLQQQITQLEQLSRVQQRFVSDVSHELRTPLTTIRMAGDVIFEARGDFDPSVGRSAELLSTQIDRFEGLLTDLLEMSRIDAGGSVLDRESTDIREILTRVVDGCRSLVDSSGSRLVPPVAVSAPTRAEVDPRRVERILRNLLVNALEHGEGRPIELAIGGNEQAVAISIRDHGVGLKPGEATLVFNRFWRADPSRARTVGGTGLGLAIAIEDARLHGGWLQAWGQPGLGSCFRLTLPRVMGAKLSGSPLPLDPTSRPPGIAVGGPYQQLHSDDSSTGGKG